MKRELVLMLAAILTLAGLGGASWQQTRIDGQAAELAQRDREIAALEGEAARLREALRPPPYCLPVEPAAISSAVGYRTDPMGGGTESLHKGVDLVGPPGAPVRAVRDGTVAEHWLVPGVHGGKRYYGHPVFGGMVVLDHGEGLYSIYGHLGASFVHEGDRVPMGAIIGEIGSTGISTGPHLHLELVVDPLRYLEGER